MKRFNIILLLFFAFLFILTGCRKDIPAGTSVYISGIVFDSVKNKALPFAKIYLFGAHKTFYGIYYTDGPYDSVTSDALGKFALQYKAEGRSVDYGLSIDQLSYGGYNYGGNNNYIVDNYHPMFKLNFSTTISDAVVRARELNYTKIALKVLNNPYDTFLVRTNAQRIPVLIKGQTIDTTVTVRHLPGQQNIFQYYTEAVRDTIGLAALNTNPNGRLYSIRRMLSDTIAANMADTIYLNKTILSSLSIPRQ